MATTIESEWTDSRWRRKLKQLSLSRCALATITLSFAAALTACGNEESAEPPATSAAVANTTPSTILPPPTTTTPTTGETGVSSTVAPAPTAPDTTSPRPVESAIQLASAAAWKAFNDAVLDPTNDRKLAALAARFDGDVLERAQGIIRQYRIEGRREVTSEIIPSTVDVIAESIIVREGEATAQVDICRVGSNVLVETVGNPDGTDRVLDDSINAHLERTELTLIDGEWKVVADSPIESFPGSIECRA